MIDTQWRNMEMFDFIDLEDTLVLNWEISKVRLTFNVEFSLRPGHSHYRTPEPDRHTCYREGKLHFLNPSNVEGLLSMQDARPSISADGTKDYGNFDTLSTSATSTFQVFGDFGEVHGTYDQIEIEIGNVA